MSLPTLYTVQDVMAATGMSERWVRQQVNGDDPVDHTRLGHKIRFTREQYDAFVARFTKAAPVQSVTTGKGRRSA